MIQTNDAIQFNYRYQVVGWDICRMVVIRRSAQGHPRYVRISLDRERERDS